jgi:hypothetical protein
MGLRSAARLLVCAGLILAADSFVASDAWARGASPAPGCLDARAVERVRHFDPDTLLVGAAGRGFVVNLADGCGARLEGAQTLLADEGWVCGRPREFVRAGETVCPIVALAPVEAKQYAELARKLDQASAHDAAAGGAVALEPLEVTAPAKRTVAHFRGDPDYCFSPAAMRGFQLDGNDIIVLTAPRRAGGHKSYRVELSFACPDLAWHHEIGFRSGVGSGLICGNPGDKVFGLDGAPGGDLRGGEGQDASRFSRADCGIAAVYPEG